MFSTGQWVFVLFFIVAFIVLMVFSYRKDSQLHKREYKGAKWILLGFIGFVALLFVIKFVLKG